LKHMQTIVQPDLNNDELRGLCFHLKDGLPETLPKQTMPLGGDYGHSLGADLSELAPLHRNDILSSDRKGAATDLSELPTFLAGMTKNSLANLIWPRVIRELSHHGVKAEEDMQNTTHISTGVRNSADGVSSMLRLNWEVKPSFMGKTPGHLTGEHVDAWNNWAEERKQKWKDRKLLGARLQHEVGHFLQKRRKRQEADLKAWQSKKGKLLDRVLEKSAEYCADAAREGKDECTVELEDLIGNDSLLNSLHHTILKPNTYSVVKDCDLSHELSVNSRSVRKLKSKWVVDLLMPEQVDPVSGAKRIQVKVRFDGSIGWATLTGEYGTVFMVPHTYVAIKEACLTNTFSDIDTSTGVIGNHHTIRKVKAGEILEVLELSRRDPNLHISRIHCRAKSDSTVGWVTVAANPTVNERVCPKDVSDNVLRGFLLAQMDKHSPTFHPLTKLTAEPYEGFEPVCGACGKHIAENVEIWTCNKGERPYYECAVCYADPTKVALQDPTRRVKIPDPHNLSDKILPELLEIWKEERVLADILYRPPPAMCQVRLRWGRIAVDRLVNVEEDSEA